MGDWWLEHSCFGDAWPQCVRWACLASATVLIKAAREAQCAVWSAGRVHVE